MSQLANASDVPRRFRRNSHGTLTGRDSAPFAKGKSGKSSKIGFPRATSTTSPVDSAESSDENDQLRIAEAKAILNCTDSTSANELPPSLQDSPPTSNRDLTVDTFVPSINVNTTTSTTTTTTKTVVNLPSSNQIASELDTADESTTANMTSRPVTRRATKQPPPAEQDALKLPEPHKSSVFSSIMRPVTNMLAASAAVFFWHPLSVITLIGPQRMRLLAQRRIRASQEDDEQMGSGSLYDGFRYAHRRAARMALNGEDGDSDESDEFLNDTTVDFKEQRKRVKEVLEDVERRIASLERRRERLLERLEHLDDDDTPPATAGVVASEPGLPRGVPLDQLQNSTISSSEESRLSAKGRRRMRTSSEIVPTCRHTLTGHDGIVTCIDLDFTSGRVVSGSSDRTVRVWDGNIGECERVLTSHSGTIYCLQLEGERLITGSQDRTIKQWDLSKLHAKEDRSAHKRDKHATKENNTTSVETERDAASKVDTNATDITDTALNEDNALEDKPHRRHRKNKIIQDAAQRSDEPTSDPCLVNTFTGHTDTVTCLHFDANCMVSGSADRTLRQWDLTTGTCVLHMDAWWAAHGARPPPSNAYGAVNESFVGALQFWQYALCSGTADGVIRMWDLRTGQAHRTLTGHVGPVNCLQFDQRSVVSGGQDGTIRIWDLRTGEVFDTVQFERPVTSLQFDDAKVLCTAGDSEVKIYNRASFQQSAFHAHREPVSCVRFAGRRVVTGGNDDVVKVWRT